MPEPYPPNHRAAVPQPLTVLLADAHTLVREGMRSLIARHLESARLVEARDGEAAVAAWAEHRPTLGFVELRLPGLDGLEVIRRIRQGQGSARLVVLTALDGDEDVFRALQVGALGFLLKDFCLEELLACLRQVLQGDRYVQASAAGKLADRLSLDTLTQRELDVLRLLARGLSNKRIALLLGIAEGTVKTHVKGLLGKLGASGRSEAIGMAHRRGLVRI